MVLVDSSVWIDYLNGNPTLQADILDSLLGHTPIAMGDLILVEVLQGFQNDRDFKQALNLFDSLIPVDMLGREIAIQSAKNYRILRQKSITVRKTMDIIIGTFCIERKFSLLHNDRDFAPMEEHLHLQVIR